MKSLNETYSNAIDIYEESSKVMALDATILYDLISSKISDKMIDNQSDNITTINGSQMQFSIIKINKAT